MSERLSQAEISEKIKEVDNWSLRGESIQKEWKFKDFRKAMIFINKIANLAEEHDHHPELYNVYNKVRLTFSTHDVGGLTDKDFKIAKEVDGLINLQDF